MMALSTRAMLMAVLTDGYRGLRRRLTGALGSPDLASEALHETWLDLNKGTELDQVRHPISYVYLAALQKAGRLRRAEQRHLATVEITDLLDLADDAPDPERIVIARSEIAYLAKTLDLLTKRQRAAFVECYLGDVSFAEVAERFGVSVRTIQNELREAMFKVTRRMLEKDRFLNARPEDSNN